MTLAARLLTGSLPPAVAVCLTYQIARIVGLIHAGGLAHGRLAPVNILLGADGRPLLSAGELTSDVTAYRAPEQNAVRGERIGPPADVYALGVILHECLTGVLPGTCPDRRRPVPGDLERIIRKCVARSPDDRYPTGDALADDLARLVFSSHRPAYQLLTPFHELTGAAVIRALSGVAWLLDAFDRSRHRS